MQSILENNRTKFHSKISRGFSEIVVFRRGTSFSGILYTRSSAVAGRPRDASCLSVVSFDSTVP